MYVFISLVLQSFNCPHKDLQTFKTVILSSEKRPLNYFVKLTICEAVVPQSLLSQVDTEIIMIACSVHMNGLVITGLLN